jgi:hypothetical protein
VPERVPHDVERRARADEVDGEGVTEPVRVHPALDARLAREPGQQVPDVRLADGSPRERAEERAAGDPALPAQLEPPADERDGAGVDTDDPSLAALAALNDERPRTRIEVLDRERERLADPKAAAPAHGDQCAVADARRRAPRALAHEELDLLVRQEISVEPRAVTSVQSRSLPVCSVPGRWAAIGATDHRRRGARRSRSLLLQWLGGRAKRDSSRQSQCARPRTPRLYPSGEVRVSRMEGARCRGSPSRSPTRRFASYVPVQERAGLADALRDLQTFGFALVED